MGSLYIKKAETADLAREVASLLGISKTQAVHDALLRRRRELTGVDQPLRAREIAAELRRTSTLPVATVVTIDRAFFDDLSGGL